jgi:hypothetical protein
VRVSINAMNATRNNDGGCSGGNDKTGCACLQRGLQMSRKNQNDSATQVQNARGEAGRILIAGVLLVMILQHAAAQPAEHTPDSLVEAAELGAHAQSLLGSCDYQNAERWLKRARSVVRDGHLRSGESDAAGNFSARIEIQIADLRDLKGRLDKEQLAIKNLIDAE